MAPDGAVTVVAGAGRRDSTDGPASVATCDGPNRIVRLRDGTFFLTEDGGRRARLLVGASR